jgi:hypothetical protein
MMTRKFLAGSATRLTFQADLTVCDHHGGSRCLAVLFGAPVGKGRLPAQRKPIYRSASLAWIA